MADSAAGKVSDYVGSGTGIAKGAAGLVGGLGQMIADPIDAAVGMSRSPNIYPPLQWHPQPAQGNSWGI